MNKYNLKVLFKNGIEKEYSLECSTLVKEAIVDDIRKSHYEVYTFGGNLIINMGEAISIEFCEISDDNKHSIDDETPEWIAKLIRSENEIASRFTK